jgi:hypothetical protein
METSLKSVQNRSSPPLFPTGSVANIPSNPIFILRYCNLNCLIFVLMRNKNLGLFSFTKRQRSRTAQGFSSPPQFQLMQLIVTGGAVPQLAPITQEKSRLLLHVSYTVSQLRDPPTTAPDISFQAEPVKQSPDHSHKAPL